MPNWIFFFQEVALPILGIGTFLVVLGAGYRLFSRMLERRHDLRLADQTGGSGPEHLRDLSVRVEALEAQTARVQELEERLDFAERLLTQGRREPGAAD